MGQQNSAAVLTTAAETVQGVVESGGKVESAALDRLGGILNDSKSLTAETVQELLSFRLPSGTGDDVSSLLKRFNSSALLPQNPAEPSPIPSRFMRCMAAAFRACRSTNVAGQQQAKVSLDVCLGLYANLSFVLALLRHFQEEISSEEIYYALEHVPTCVNGAQLPADATLVRQLSSPNDKLPRNCFRLSYLTTSYRVFQVSSREDCLPMLRSNIISWVESIAPQDVWTLTVGAVLFREATTGKFVSLRQVVSEANIEGGNRNFAIMPLLPRWPRRSTAPMKAYSPVQEFVLESLAFVVLTQAQLLQVDDDTHVNTLRRIHALILEILLWLFSLVISNNKAREWITSGATGDPLSEEKAPTTQPRSFPEFFAGEGQAPVTAPFVAGILGHFAFVRGEASMEYDGLNLVHLCKAFISALVNGLWLDHPYLRYIYGSSRPAFQTLTAKASLHSAEICPNPIDQNLPVQRLSTISAALLAVLVAHPCLPMPRTHLMPQLGSKSPENPAFTVQTVGTSDVLVVLNCCPQILGTVTDAKYFAEIPNEMEAKFAGIVPVNFDLLLAAFCSPERLKFRLTSMMLYILVLRIRAFRLFVSSRADAGLLVMAILRVVSEVSKGLGTAAVTATAAQRISPSWVPLPPVVTLLTVVLLVLARDQQFASSLFQTALPSCPEWLAQGAFRNQLNQKPTSEALAETTVLSAGSAAVLVLLKASAMNLRVSREPFGHIVMEGAITNLGNGVINLHWLVAERLLEFIKKVGKQTVTKLGSVIHVDQPETWAALPLLPFAILEQRTALNGIATEPGTPDEGTTKQVDSSLIEAPVLDRSPFSFESVTPEGWADLKNHFHTLRGLISLLSAGVRQRPNDELQNLSLLYVLLRNQQVLQMLRDLMQICKNLKAAKQRKAELDLYWEEWTKQTAEWEAYRQSRASGAVVACPVKSWPEHGNLPEIRQPESTLFSGDDEVSNLREALIELVVRLDPQLQSLVSMCEALLNGSAADDDEMNVDAAIASISERWEELCSPESSDVKKGKIDTVEQESPQSCTRYGYRETAMSCNYFLPLIWKAINAA